MNQFPYDDKIINILLSNLELKLHFYIIHIKYILLEDLEHKDVRRF